MTAAFLLVLSVTALAVLANFVAMLFALRAMRRAQQTLGERIEAAAGDTQHALAETRQSHVLAAQSVEAAQASAEAALAETRRSYELAQQSHELAKESNDLTRRNLEAVERALEFSKRAFEVAHQPSLHIVKVETISGNSSVDTMLSARVSLRNTGTSDAHDVVISGRFNIGPVNFDEIEFPQTAGGQSQGFAAPDLVVHGTIQQSLTFELRDAISRSGRLFLVSCVRHGDDFGATHLAVFIRAWTGGQWVAVREKRKRIDG
ncbi:MAG TPA: hypothetical protein VGQ36_01565 [Thermoanaerobaculia bacterium]|nr:hypothetical protein [Thermoanaerobaculia bacterium]